MSKVSRKRTRDDGNNMRENQDGLPAVGKSYRVEREAEGPRKGQKMHAIILHVEWKNAEKYVDYPEVEEKPEEGPSDPKVEKIGEDGKKKKLMFYVHYPSLDRRNDEWVHRNKIFEEVDSQGNAIVLPGSSEAVRVGALTRSLRKIHEEFNHLKQDYTSMDARTARLEREHEERTKVKNIPAVIVGKHKMQAWYYSPFPAHCKDRTLYMCEWCLLYTPYIEQFRIHAAHCKARQPPGNEIYRKGNLSMFEVDGFKSKLYSQCLCLLSKLFMDHKTLYFDVKDFMFYVICETDEEGAHIVGYFSREVESANNLACIMIFPPFQDKGYGKLLIQLSYELSRREGYIGTPEKPLSDLGKVSYRSFWWWILLDTLERIPSSMITATELSEASGIVTDDIISTLAILKMIRQYKDGGFLIRTSRKLLEQCRENEYGKPPKIALDTSCLKWKPALRRDEVPIKIRTKSERKTSTTPAFTPPVGLSSAEHSPIPTETNTIDFDGF